MAAILKTGWLKTGSEWTHPTAAKQAGLPDFPIVVRKYPWERRGTNAKALLARFADGPLAKVGERPGDTRADAALALLVAGMATRAKAGAA